MNGTKVKSFLITVCCLFLALFSDSQSMEYNRQHIERGQEIFMSLNKDWDVSRNATFFGSQILAEVSLGIGNIQEIGEDQRRNIQSILGAFAAIPFVAHASVASDNLAMHGNYSIFSNINAQLQPLFYQNIGERYQNKDEIIFETLRQTSVFRGSDDNFVRTVLPIAWLIPEFRVALNTKLETVYRNIQGNT